MDEPKKSARVRELQKAYAEGRAPGSRWCPLCTTPRGAAKIDHGKILCTKDCRCSGRGIVPAETYNAIMHEREQKKLRRKTGAQKAVPA